MKKLSPVGLTVVLALTLAIAGCVSNGGNSGNRQPTVYVAGNTIDIDSDEWQACYWTSSNPTPTLLGEVGDNSFANSICISGGKIYVGGITETDATIPDTLQACYWVDGELTLLDGSGTDVEVHSICVSGSNVYCAGSSDRAACYWTNSAKTSLLGATGDSNACSISVSNGTVYFIGSANDGTNDRACYWTNSNPNLTFVSEAGKDAEVTSGCFYGATVYVSGTIDDGSNDRSCYWTSQNATPVILGQSGVDTIGNAICVQ